MCLLKVAVEAARRNAASLCLVLVVRLIDVPKGGASNGGTLELAGVERIPVASDGDDSTGELIELLSR